MTKMHCRPYQPSDLPSLVDIHVSSAPTDALTQFLEPDLFKYRASHRINIYNYLRGHILGVRRSANAPFIMQVLETDASDYISEDPSQAPEVVGFAFWLRMGTSEIHQEWQRKQGIISWAEHLNKRLVAIEEKYYDLFPSVLPSVNKRNSAKMKPAFRHVWDPEVFIEAWYLDHLFVRQDWQRRGLGKKLMGWGLKQAQEEKVPVLVNGTPLGGRAYRAAGFRPLFSFDFGKLTDETKFGGEQAGAWVWEPKLEGEDGIEGKWYERAKLKLNTTEES